MASNQVKYIITLQDKASAAFKKLSTNADKSDKKIKGFGSGLKGLQSGGFNPLMGTIAKFAGPAYLGAKFIQTVGEAGAKIADFEDEVSTLRSITGASGDDLDYLRKKAIELGGASTKSSVDTIQAFKLIASAKPDLLANSAALADVTEKAIKLSEASRLELPTAASSLTSVLNQYSLAASEADRVINVLAAGSKFGASEIPSTAEAIKVFGVNAKDMGVSVEQSVAAVQALAEKGIFAAEAGTKIRNVLLNLAAGADETNPEIVGLDKALENLAAQNLSTAEMAKRFGVQNIAGAKILVQNRKRVQELTEAVTGTSIAHEQAAINVDNFKGDVSSMSSAYERMVLTINEGNSSINKGMRATVQFATSMLNKLTNIIKGRDELVKEGAKEGFDKRIGWLKDMLSPEQLTDEEAVRSAMMSISQSLKKSTDEMKDELYDLGGEVTKTDKLLSGLMINPRKMQERGALSQVIAENEAMLEKFNDLLKFGGEDEFNKFFAGLKAEVEPEIKLPDVPDLGKLQLDTAMDKQIKTITGAAPKTFNINVESLIENFEISTQNITESAASVKRQISLALAEALADVQPITD